MTTSVHPHSIKPAAAVRAAGQRARWWILLLLASVLMTSPAIGQTRTWRWWPSRSQSADRIKKATDTSVVRRTTAANALHEQTKAQPNVRQTSWRDSASDEPASSFQMPTLNPDLSGPLSTSSRAGHGANRVVPISQVSKPDGYLAEQDDPATAAQLQPEISPRGSPQPFIAPPPFQPPASFRPLPVDAGASDHPTAPTAIRELEFLPQTTDTIERQNSPPQLSIPQTSAPPDPSQPPHAKQQRDLASTNSDPVAWHAGRYAFNFSEAPWQMVLRQFARQHSLSLQMGCTIDGDFTYFDQREYTLPQSLDILNDHLLTRGLILVRQRDNLVLLNATSDIPDGLIPFVQLEQLTLLGRNELATVAIPVEKSDIENAVTEISQFLSDLGRVQPLSNSNRVIVTDTGAYLRRIFDLVTGRGIAAGTPTTFVYELRHSSAEEVANAINSFYSANPGNGGGEFSGQGQQVVVAEKTTNSLLVREGLADNSAIHSMIQQLDRAPREVLIQAVLVEVQLGNTDEFGVEVGFQDSVLFDRSVIDNIVTVTETVTSPVGTQTTNQRIVSQTAAPGFNFNNQPLGNNVTVNPSAVAGQALSTFGVGRVNGDLGYGGLVLSAGSESVNVLLRALSARFDIDILSRPQIRAVDNREAMIQIGQQVPVVDGVSVTAVGSANPVIRQDQAGIILKVTPRISPESQVLIDVQAEKSAFQLAAGSGVPIFTDATNGNVIEAPVKDITTANTTVSVRTGQTIVLGGMITKENAVTERKVPFLGDIPVLGHLFRHDINKSSRRELLIFLTPHVIHCEADAERLKHQEITHIHMPDSAAEFSHQLYNGHTFSMPSGPGCVPVPDDQLPASAEHPPTAAGDAESFSPLGHSGQF